MSDKPVRVQRRRVKGFKLADAAGNGLPTVYVGRGTGWGNPFVVGKDGTREECVAMFKKWFNADITPVGSELYEFRRKHGWRGFTLACVVKHHLGGKNLACWCPTSCECHADVLLELANA